MKWRMPGMIKKVQFYAVAPLARLPASFLPLIIIINRKMVKFSPHLPLKQNQADSSRGAPDSKATPYRT
jgi:hypothetical protein